MGRHFLRDQVGRKPGDFAPDAGTLARQDGNLPVGDVLLRPVFTHGAMSSYPFDCNLKIGCMVGHLGSRN
jgi:hypothetical protein